MFSANISDVNALGTSSRLLWQITDMYSVQRRRYGVVQCGVVLCGSVCVVICDAELFSDAVRHSLLRCIIDCTIAVNSSC